MNKNTLLPTLALALLPAALLHASDNPAPMEVVPSVDLGRYSGLWYEIAHLPNRFQRVCAASTTAQYTLRPDGKIAILNRCRSAKGEIKSARGTAHVAHPEGPNTKLRVTFFWPFYGDYWILDLDPDYRWAVVGEPKRKYFWIISREPTLDDAVYAGILERARGQGYQLDSLIRTAHPERAASASVRATTRP